MKKYWVIFLLHFQDAFESRSRSVVWFLLALLNPLIALLFWYGALRVNSLLLPGWNISSIGIYYFLLIVANALLNVHIEEEVAYEDIQQGRLSVFLIRPFSYLFLKLCTELSYRLIQGFLGIISLILISELLKLQLIKLDILTLPLVLLITIFAFVISFLLKMIVGLSAFWITDSRGMQEFVFVVVLTLAGFVMPLDLFPPLLAKISNILPFAYMIYYPIVAFQGKLTVYQSFSVLTTQLIWVVLLGMIYRKMWRSGIKLFTGAGL